MLKSKIQVGYMLPKDVIEMIRFISFFKKVYKSEAVEMAIMDLYHRCVTEANAAKDTPKQ